MSPTPYLPTVDHHRVEASAKVTFDPDQQPTVTAKGGTIHGCVFALRSLTLTVVALSAADGEVLTYTLAIPEVERLVHDNGDGTDYSHWRFLTVAPEDYPAEVQPTLDVLRTAVATIHPNLRLPAADTSSAA